VKAAMPHSGLDPERLSPFVAVYYEFVHLKQLYRQGWIRNGVPAERCESVAEHSFGVAILALFLVDAYMPSLDRATVIRMALLHDFGEIYAGDLVPGAVTPEEKHRLEADSVARVLGRLPNGEAYLSLWNEYEAAATPEARFVRQVDRLEMGLQASVYQRQGLLNPAEFYQSAIEALVDDQLRALLEELTS
jgi:putative hydrolases of HD superfamily